MWVWSYEWLLHRYPPANHANVLSYIYVEIMKPSYFVTIKHSNYGFYEIHEKIAWYNEQALKN